MGGSYEGVDPMGPFWAMKADPGSKNIGGRLLPVDVTKPLEFKVQVNSEDQRELFEPR